MNKILFVSLTIVALLAISSCSSPESDQAKTGDAQKITQTTSDAILIVDTAMSRLEWIGTKVTAHHAGTVNIKSGELQIKDGKVSGGKFVLDMPTLIATNKDPRTNEKLTGHLRSPDFFDVTQFPESTFEITAVKPFQGTISATDESGQEEINQYKITDPNYMVSGNLTIKGITKNIEFPAKISVSDNRAEATAKFNIDRKEWGIIYPGAPDDLIKDLIWFGISLKASKS